MTTPPALLIAGPGTRDEAGVAAVHALVQELERRAPGLPVAGGLVEQAPRPGAPPTGPERPASPQSPSPQSHSPWNLSPRNPSPRNPSPQNPSPQNPACQPALPLADAVAGLAERGVTRCAAVPLTLVGSGRAADGVTDALADETRRHPGIAYRYGRALGPHPLLLRALDRRLDEALGEAARSPSDRARTTVLLVGAGSTDPAGNAEVHLAARLLWEGRGFAGVETAFVSLAAPDVPSGLDRCLRLGAQRIVVLPYFLFAGALPDRAWQQSEGWASAHPEVEVISADVIGPAEELADLVLERYREAVGDGPEQLCDSCARPAEPWAGAPGTVPRQHDRAGAPAGEEPRDHRTGR
ncbi:CbiX/SirB N-terminal domain-containing protein [Streptomyces sp. bgisy100]|uniref:sirohydrochlorin chelatase n=1 Tax=Streptomyces sp. bgisy100 TaxID=3413783 RepID=UPI003D7217E5